MKKYKLYKSGKILVTGLFIAGLVALTGISNANADVTDTTQTNVAVVATQADKATTTISSSTDDNKNVTTTDNSGIKNSLSKADTENGVAKTEVDKDSQKQETVSQAKQDTENTVTNKSEYTQVADNNKSQSSETTKAQETKSTLTDNSTDNSAKQESTNEFDVTKKPNSSVSEQSVARSKVKVAQQPIKNGWVNENGRQLYYDNGRIVVGEKKIDNAWYNFDSAGKYSTGLTNLATKTVFYDNNGQMHYGYLKTDNTYMYFDTRDGHAVTGERYYGNHQMEYYGQDFKQVRNAYVRTGNTYYFIGQYGDAVTGERYYDNYKMEYYGQDFKQVRNNYVRTGNTYYFIGQYGDAVTGERYYDNHKMEYYGQDFKQVRNNYVHTGNTYYFIGQYGDAVTGLRVYGNQPNQVEYYDKNNFKQVRNADINENGKNYHFGGNGDLIIADKPAYFSQLDWRWGNHRFNDYTMAQAGCVPTSVAMVLNGSYGIRVSPDDVRNVMNIISTNSFGATGQDLINATRYYGHTANIVNTVEQTVQLLQQGVPVIHFVGVGGGITHAIVTYGYNNGATQVFDPYNQAYFNGWYNVNYIASRISRDSGDWNAGRPVFAIM
ncbi:KxYKxGKxW signal peptide domain-containing protein [Leuconostoc citreum]